MWYRVELDSTGGILNCEPVETPLVGSNTVLFVDQPSAELACIAAKRLYDKQYLKRRREIRIAEGRCRDCSNRAEKPGGYCEVCRARARANAKQIRERKKQAGLNDRDKLPKSMQLGKRMGNVGNIASKRRLKVLLECLEKLDRKTKAEFREWLLDEIASAKKSFKTKVEDIWGDKPSIVQQALDTAAE